MKKPWKITMVCFPYSLKGKITYNWPFSKSFVRSPWKIPKPMVPCPGGIVTFPSPTGHTLKKKNTGYPLVNCHITMENHHVQWENPLFLWSFSIAMWNYQMVLCISNCSKLKTYVHWIAMYCYRTPCFEPKKTSLAGLPSNVGSRFLLLRGHHDLLTPSNAR